MGGLVLNSAVEKRSSNSDSVRMVLRVPVLRLDEVRATIKYGVVRVDRDSLEARDVTKEYFDSASRLKNMLAEEDQYRAILRQARTVEDTLQVTERLSDVRAEIEQMQGTLNFLKNQAELATVQISIIAETEAQVAGIRWRPMYQAKAAMMSGLEGLTDYANAMLVFFFRLPVVLLWLLTLMAIAATGWRLTQWVWRRLRSVVTPAAQPV